MKGKNVAIAAGVTAGLGGIALILLSRKKAEAAPPEPPPEGMANLYGKVTNSRTGNGIFGVRVTTTGAITETDSNGDYAALDIPPGSWGVRFEKDGYETKEVTVSIQEGNNELNMQLVPTTAPPPSGEGEISFIYMWYEGLATWGVVWTNPEIPIQLIPGEIPLDGEVYLAPAVLNGSGISVLHVDLEVTYPDGTKRTLSATAGQDSEAAPGEGGLVEFEPFTSSQEGTYTVEVTFSSDGQVLDTVTFSLTAVQKIEITGITVNPTNLTTTRGEYETSLGLGFWGDPFTISMTFNNPFVFDVWVKPDYAFGKLTGEPLEFVEETQPHGGGTQLVLHGFTPEELLYFRMLLQSEYIEGDYSHPTAWQKPWDPRGQNMGSNMQFVYDPDGVPRAGDERWLKIPAGGSKTMVKGAHLSDDLQVTVYKCALCGEIITGSATAHYESNHPGVEITCWSWGGWSGCYIVDSGENAIIQAYGPAEGVVGPKDLCVVAWKAMYFVYDPGCGQTRVGGKVVTLNWRLEELDPVAAVVPNQITIT